MATGNFTAAAMLPSPNELPVRPANQHDEQVLAKSLHFVDHARNLIVSYLNHGIVFVFVSILRSYAN